MSTWFLLFSQFPIIAFALVGGVFLAFSDFIMRSLGTVSSSGGIEVMQAINQEVFKWVFMTLFLGMAAACLLIIGYALVALTGPEKILIMLAAGLYLLGVFGVTVVINVPLNERLKEMDFMLEATAHFWNTQYLPIWTFWNSVRASASILAACLYLFAVILHIEH